MLNVKAPRLSKMPPKSNSGSPSLPVPKLKPSVAGSKFASADVNEVRYRLYPKRISLMCVGENVERKLKETTCTRVGEICENCGNREPVSVPIPPNGNVWLLSANAYRPEIWCLSLSL